MLNGWKIMQCSKIIAENVEIFILKNVRWKDKIAKQQNKEGVLCYFLVIKESTK